MKLQYYFFKLFDKLFDNRPLFYAFGVIFRAVLELSYRDFVSPLYEYAGFIMEHNPGKYIESWVLYIVMLLFLPASVRKPSDFLVCLAFFFFIAPLLVFYGFANPDRWALYCVLIQYAIMILVRGGRPIFVPVLKGGPAIAVTISIIGIIVATAWMIVSVGFSSFNLDLYAVYEFREKANSTIYSGVLGYIVVWATAVLGPFILMLALRGRRHFLTLSIFALHVFWFGLSSHKAVLFYPMLVVFLYTFFKYSRALSLVPLGLSFVVMVSLINYYMTESLLTSSLFIRRLLFVPSHLAFTYLDFFDQNPLVYWSNSFLSWLVPYPYDVSVALVIGNYLNDPGLWANNSFFSTGYMHAGLLGVVFYGLVAGLILKILDSLTRQGVPLWMSLSVVIVPFYNLFTSSDLTTTLLSHGLGFGIFMLYLIGRLNHSSRGAPTSGPRIPAMTSNDVVDGSPHAQS